MRNRALQLVGGNDDPGNQPIVIIGHPQGFEHSFFPGFINAAVRTRAEVYKTLGAKVKLPPAQAALKAIQHSVYSTNG
ncbi:MAG TPA: hypothetical protein VKU02_07570, partial [Gemmataceae bacterium]|nr:hypothetical protein [Gemmataceae bacterium]